MKSSDTSIEVVLANFNHARSITEAIAAFNQQTTKPQTIHVVDDCSSDESREVLLALNKEYDNLNLIFNEANIGAVATYEKGLSAVKSKYVYFAAADDSIFPELFSECLHLLSKHENAAFACTSAIIVDLETARISMRPMIQPRIVNSFMNPSSVEKEFRNNDNWILTGTAVYVTEMIQKEGGFVAELGAFADSMLARKLAFKYGCVFSPYLGLKWNVSKHGFSRGIFSDNDNFQKFRNIVSEYIKNENGFPRWYGEKFISRMDFMFIRLNTNKFEKYHLKSQNLIQKSYWEVYQLIKLIRSFLISKPFSLRRYFLQLIYYQIRLQREALLKIKKKN